MQRMNRVFLIAVATTLMCGCANPREQKGFAQHPQLKSGKAARGSNRKQEVPTPPRILPETNYAAGRIFEQQGSPEKAIEQYRKAIAVNHEYTAAYARLGLMLSITGQHEESVKAFSRAVELKPDSAILRNNLGFELLYVERWGEAERHLREAVRLDAKLAQSHINLGLLLGRTQRYEQAVDSFRKVLPEPDAYYNLGLLQLAQSRHAQAAESFHHVLTINPEFNAAQRQLVQVERKLAAAGATKPTFATSEGVQTVTTIPARAPSNATASASAPFVDFGALIDDMVKEPTKDTNNVTTRPDSKVSDAPAEKPAPGPETRITRSSAGALVDPNQPIEVIVMEPDAPAPAAEDVPASVTTLEPRIPLQWELTLLELAHALNVADGQRNAIDELQTITTQPGPLVPGQEDAEALDMGPPAPSHEEVTLVLGTSETRPLVLASKLSAPTPALSPHAQEAIKAMDELDISIQIIRNEIQCQKEYGSSDAETSSDGNQEHSLEFTPIEPQTHGANQPTDFWQSKFGPLDNLLAVVRNESICTQEVTVAQTPAVTPQEEKAPEMEEPTDYGPALRSPPTTPQRRVRWSGKDSKRK